MADDYANVNKSVYSGLEPEHEYSIPERDGDNSDKGSLSGRSDNGSVGHRNGSDGDQSDREDGRSDREERRSVRSDLEDRQSVRSDREERQSVRSDREERRSVRSDRDDRSSNREEGRSVRSDREDGRSDSHSIHDREGSLRGSDDGPRDQSGDVYEALEEMDDLVAQVEAEQSYYSNADQQDRKSDGSQSDGEEGGHGRVRRSDSIEGARANVGDDAAIYDEIADRGSDSEGSEKGDRDRGDGDRLSDDHYDNAREEHARKNGHQRRGSQDSDEEIPRSFVDGGVKRQASSSAPTSSGKFVLRTSRKADALHVLRHIRDSSSADDNPEMDELVTVLRSTDSNSKHDDTLEEEKQKEKIKSFITSKLIHKFEQGIASEDGIIENHDDHSSTGSSKNSESHNKTTVVKTTVGNTTVVKTTVGKTTVVKTTVRNDDVSPVSPKGFPKSPTSPAAGPFGYGSTASSSSSSSLSSASQTHQKSVTYESQQSNSGVTKSVTTTGLQVTVVPSRHPVNESPKSPGDSSTPAWKTEIENRKKTKSHIPTQKPREPMKMSEVPEWKKQLQEKNKMKKLSSSDEPDITLARVTTVEMGRIKHEMVITHGDRGDKLPEWARLADEKQKTISH